MYQSPYGRGGGGNPQNYRAQMQAQQQKQLQMIELLTVLPALTRANQAGIGNASLSLQAAGLPNLSAASTMPDVASVVNTLKSQVAAGFGNDGAVYGAERQNFVLKLLLGGGLNGGGGINDLLTLSLLTGGLGGGGGLGGLI